MIPTIKCPCLPNKPCPPGYNVILTEEEFKICNEDSPEGAQFIRDLITGLILHKKIEGQPSFIQRVTNFVGAIIQHINHGLSVVNDDTQKKRMDICNQCPKNIDGVCSECGCYLSTKTRWSDQKCPIDKWPAIELPLVQIPQRSCCGV